MTTARAWRAAFAVIGLCAIGLQYVIMVTTPSDLSLAELTLNFFSFFTILTNVMITACLLMAALSPAGWWASPSPRSATTMYGLVVLVVYHFLLHALWKPEGWALIANVLLHYVMPLLMLADWILFTPKGRLTWKQPAIWLTIPLVYGAWTMIHGVLAGWWPYWFINADTLGYGRALTNYGGLLIFFLGLGLVVVLIDGLWRRDRTASPA